jgi:hypothetical protein
MVKEDRLRGEPSEAFDRLLAAYRDACPDPEPTAEFMPGLWRKIEARQTFAFTVRRLARAIITAAAIASLAMGFYVSHFEPRVSPTYLEQLAGGTAAHDSLADSEIVQAMYERNR